MKRFCVLIILLALFAVPSFAAPTVVVTKTAGYQSGNGGELTVTPSAELTWVMAYYDSKAIVGNGFQSFCLEVGEAITANTTLNAVIQNNAIAGGVIDPLGDPISQGTAWLYHDFQNGTLANYDYTPGAGRVATAGALQDTIWWLEGEVADPGAGNVFRNAVITQFGNATTAMADNNGSYPVAVLHLMTVAGGPAQDVLVCVPAPGALLLAGMGAGLVGLLKRRRSL